MAKCANVSAKLLVVVRQCASVRRCMWGALHQSITCHIANCQYAAYALTPPLIPLLLRTAQNERKLPQLTLSAALWCSEWCESVLLHTNLVIVTRYRLAAYFISYSTCCVAFLALSSTKRPFCYRKVFFSIYTCPGYLVALAAFLVGFAASFLAAKGNLLRECSFT